MLLLLFQMTTVLGLHGKFLVVGSTDVASVRNCQKLVQVQNGTAAG